MDWDKFDMNPRVIAAIKKANITSIEDIFHLSGSDLQRLTKLSKTDVQYLLRTISSTLRKNSVFTALQLFQNKAPSTSQGQKLSLGCPVLDGLLRGGIPHTGITEIAGESSAGKTQIALQLCLSVQYPYRYGGLESGSIISQDLKWTANIKNIIKKGQQRMFFLRQLSKLKLPKELLIQFYRGIIESVICTSITVWFGSVTQQERHRLQRIIRTAEKIIATNLPSIEDLYTARIKKRAGKIFTDPSHPGHKLFQLLPSKRRYRGLHNRTTRHKNSFFPKAITLLNQIIPSTLSNYLLNLHYY
ncbi:DNA repair protein XRCC3 isoform X3 [Ahaetulla prasina]|uniref:DNA repair protein XRCC3 isoform X3 n=1 Tax=Ahaetulla prasina TaxID=499056 RepID=UPI00264903C7|nr:DNA repair protein XRCC3 isoform X3 [Ahaetulla prasina]